MKAAVIQAAPVAFRGRPTLDRSSGSWPEADRRPGRLSGSVRVVLSTLGIRLGAVVGSLCSNDGRAWFRRYWESSIDVPGPATERSRSHQRERGRHLVIGVIERGGGTLYCTALFFALDGTLLGKHRKLMPTGAERLVRLR